MKKHQFYSYYKDWTILLCVLVFQIIFANVVIGQEYQNENYVRVDHSNTTWAKEMVAKKPNVFKAEAAYKAYFKQRPLEESKLRNIFRRWIEDAKLSMDKNGNHIPNPYLPAELMTPKNNIFRTPTTGTTTGTWRAIGPNYAERTQCGTSSNLSGGFCDRVYINPHNTDNLFAGFSYGGLWVSQDQGDTWVLTDAHIPNGTNTYANRDLYYGEIEASSIDPAIVYAATEYALLKSSDSGENWSICPQLNRNDSGNTRAYYLALSNADSNMVLATFGRQVFRSIDGGDNWTVVFDNSNGGDNHYYTSQYSNNSTFGIYDRTYNFFGLENDATDPNVFYLGVWNAQNNPEIYKSTDGGLTFLPLVNLNESLDRTLPSNLVLKASQSQSDKFFIHSLFTPLDSLYQYDGLGELQERSLINAFTNSFNTDVTTLEAFAINPADEETVYAGFYFASSIMKSTNGGDSFTDLTSGYSGCPKYVHPDIRSIDVQGDLVLIGSDGGLAISKDAMVSVSSDIGREISSIDLWGFTSSPRTDLVAVGCDHGPTKIRRFDGEDGWVSVGGGDASDLSINYSNEGIIVFDRAINYQFMGLLDDDNNLLVESSINNDISLDQVAFHPNIYPTAYFKEGADLKKSADNFSTINLVHTFSSNINVIRIAPRAANILFVIHGNTISKSVDEGLTWQNITPSSSASGGQTNIRDLVIGENENEIWVAYGNWQNSTKILKSIDGGISWDNITTDNLPLAPVSQIANQPGTDGGVYMAFAGGFGVWYRNNSMTAWEELGTGLPTFGYIRNIYTVPNKGSIRIGSSRGVWEHDLFEPSKPVASFATETNQIACGNEITFIQNSLHTSENVTYEWFFEGGTPAQSFDAEPEIGYWYDGVFDVSLTITDADGNSNTHLLNDFINVAENAFCESVQVVENNFGALEIFPIPTQTIINVYLPEVEPEIFVELLNIKGQLVLKKNIQNQSKFNVNLSKLSSGAYFLKIRSGEKFAHVKIIKE